MVCRNLLKILFFLASLNVLKLDFLVDLSLNSYRDLRKGILHKSCSLDWLEVKHNFDDLSNNSPQYNRISLCCCELAIELVEGKGVSNKVLEEGSDVLSRSIECLQVHYCLVVECFGRVVAEHDHVSRVGYEESSIEEIVVEVSIIVAPLQ